MCWREGRVGVCTFCSINSKLFVNLGLLYKSELHTKGFEKDASRCD